jgi:hypothetical protein
MSNQRKLRINKETMRALTQEEGAMVAGGTTTGACVVTSAITSNIASVMITNAIGCNNWTKTCLQQTQACGGNGGSGGYTGMCGMVSVSGSGSGISPPPPPPPPPPPITTAYGDGTVCY